MGTLRRRGYAKRNREQLENWVKGKSVHNIVDNECCPDFSCCKPNLLASQEVRDEFLKATNEDNEKKVHAMLMQFLSKLLDDELPGKSVHING